MARRFYKAPSGGGVPGTFKPTDITGLQLWFDASDINNGGTQPTSGASVTTWKDKSSNNRNASYVSTTYPTYNSTGFNTNKPTITWPSTAATTSGFATSAFGNVFNFTTTSGGMTYFVVFNAASNTNTYLELISKCSSLGTDITLDLYNNEIYAGTNHNTGAVDVKLQTTAIIYECSINPVSNNIYMTNRINGETVPSYNAISNANASWTEPSTGTFNIGYRPMGNAWFTGNISEILAYNVSFTSAVSNRQKVEGYLAWKWGLTGSLPTGHPYKTVQP